MKKRHGKSVARENAIKVLYSYNISGKVNVSSDSMANTIAENTIENIDNINQKIVDNLKKWSIKELNKVNLSILQVAVYEIIFEDTPNNIVVNDALELAKKYSDIKSKNFIHKTLDTISKGK